MKDIEIKISRKTSCVDLPKRQAFAVGGENLQGNLIFSFNDEFVNGQARLELTIDGQDSWIPLLKEEETYYCPIKSAITKKGQIDMQLVITENENEDGIPIFKSNTFYLWCESSINAEIEQPEEYPTWIEIANEKLNEMDNLDIEATKEDDTATITITKKDGTEQSVEIVDGPIGPQGEAGPAGQDAKINGVNTLNIVAGDNITIEQEDDTMTISSTGGGGGASEYVVRLTKENDEITSDKTISEIITAYNNGNIVKGVLTDTEIGVDFNLQLLIAFEDSDFGLVQFATVYDSGDDFKSITIIGTLENNEDSWQYLDKEIVSDSDYVHTDNNYTNAEKTKLAGLENKIITVNADPQTMVLDKSADEINEYLNNGYIVMALGYQVFRNDYDASAHTIKLAVYFGAFGQVITVTGNQVTNVNEYYYVSDYDYVHTDNNFSYYYKDKLDNAPEVVDLSNYSVGDTITDTALVSQLMNNRCKIKYGTSIYSFATTMGTGYIYTVMNSLTAGAFITLNYNSGSNTFYFYEVGTAPWEVPSNKVQNLDNPTTETYPSALAVYNALQNAGGGDKVYLGDITEITQAHPIDLTNLKAGLYFIKTPSTISNNDRTLYFKATVNGSDITGSFDVDNSGGQYLYNIIVLKIDTAIEDMTITSTATVFGKILYFRNYENTVYGGFFFHNHELKISTSSISRNNATTSYKVVTRDLDQTISGKKTFSTIPELSSSLTPTTDYQLVNKKYVDDNAGGGESYVVNIKPNYFSSLTTGDIQNIVDKLLENNNNQIYLLGDHSGYRDFDMVLASLDGNLSSSTTSYVLNVWKFSMSDTVTSGVGYAKQAYNVYITWNNNIPTVSSTSKNGQLQSNTIYINGNTSSWTPSTNYSPVHKKYVDDKPKTYTGYDATKTQVLKNINGTLTWVDET